MRYRLGLDIGANSIGWCALTLDADGQPTRLQDIGVRVYPDGRNPKDGSSLAAARRGPRALRRNRDRYLQRRKALLNALSRFGLMPTAPDERSRVAGMDPYALRAAALHRRLTPEELGRAVFHLSQHRGFKSNRKADRNSNEGGLIREAAANTQAELARAGHLTIGSWLADRHLHHDTVRVRLAGSGKSAAYAFYPLREMVEAELDAIWRAQAAWDPTLTPTMHETLKGIVFFQRPLKSPPVGRCWLELGEERAPRALPTAQRYRIAQTLAHLRLHQPGMPERALTDNERSLLARLLYRGSDQTFDQVRKKLGLPQETDFNMREEKLVACATAARLGAKKVLGNDWHDFTLADQDAAVAAMLEAEADEAAVAALIGLGLPPDAAARAAATTLPDGHAALSAVALGKILPHLEAGQRYNDAVQSAGYPHHSDRRTGELRDRLPYYGAILRERIGTGTGEPNDPEEKRLGRAPNPTVHVALNEVRRVVNAIVERHGPPAEIVIETLRDLGRSKKQREDYEKEQRKNRDANDRRQKQLETLGLPVNSRNRMRLRLWEEQAADPKNRVCPYTGTLITPATALSDRIEEDHTLPFATTLDDGAANRVLVTREANRVKAKRSPFDAFGHTPEWPAILERVALLPENKRWRFQPNAVEKLAVEGDFLARHLADSATIARWATEYLEVLAPGKVRSVPGRLTSLLRNALGLNSRSVLGKGGAVKERTDHRHHAIDAVVVALTDRGMLQRVTRAAKAAEASGERLVVALEPPWDGFVATLAERVQAVVVSHKPDIGWQAALHNDTAYGAIAGAGPREPNVVVRRPIVELTSKDPKKIRVRDPAFAALVAAALTNPEGPARRAALSGITDPAGRKVLRLRTVERQDTVVEVANRKTGVAYKRFKRDGNHRFELWRLPDGTLKRLVVSTFDAAREAQAKVQGKTIPDRRPHPAAKLLMRLHKNDMIAIETEAGRRVLVLKQLSADELAFADHNEAGSLRDRHRDHNDPFAYVLVKSARKIFELKARKVYVMPDGRVFDPGRSS